MKLRVDRSFALAAILSLVVSGAIGQNLPVAKPESVGMSTIRLDGVKAMLQAEVDKGNIPGAVIMVNRKGKLVYAEAVGFQDKAKNVPMKKDSIFRIYSMT